MIKNRRSILTIGSVLLTIFILSQCIGKNAGVNDPRGTAFAGSASCRQCHQVIYDSVLKSAHFNASAPASFNNVQGNFEADHNSFIYDSITKIVMERRHKGMYQVLYVGGKEVAEHRFDISFGGRNAQTWLYWKADNVFELPISYYSSIHNWATSPGFSATTPEFTRMIGRDCFECHSSFVAAKQTEANAGGNYFSSEQASESLSKESLVYSIDCERCHGPAAEHVDFHLENPSITTAMFIVSAKTLNRQQNLDMCAVCHGGNDGRKLKSRFLFRPGENLADYFLQSAANTGKPNFDVHGNQFGLMAASECFLQSKSMTCSTCHNPHENAKPSHAFYIQKCMGCHSEANRNYCTAVAPAGITIKDGCINCHMPRQNSSAITFQLSGNAPISSYILRTHRIAIYADSSMNKRAFKK